MRKKVIYIDTISAAEKALKQYEKVKGEPRKECEESILFGQLLAYAKVLDHAHDEAEKLRKQCADMLDKIEEAGDVELDLRLCE